MSDSRNSPRRFPNPNEPPPKRKSSTKFGPLEYQDDEGNWRVKIVALQTKFDDVAKQTFLHEYCQHARMLDSAQAAGVSASTVRKHMELDPEFAEACYEAELEYRDKLISHHQSLVFEGTTKINYDRQGNKISEERIYPIRLIELELKKHDEGYRDKREVDMKVSGGVMIAPPDVGTIDDWESKFANGPVIDGDTKEEKDGEG